MKSPILSLRCGPRFQRRPVLVVGLLVLLASLPLVSVLAEPPTVNPGPVGGPPSDAIVLFDGESLSEWRRENGASPHWKLGQGFMEVAPGGGLFSKREFGDCQLRVEWATPAAVSGESQGRGNSGVYLMGRYEVQVLDSWRNQTPPLGQAGALYGVSAPLVNASRPPGEWQTFDIIFRAPRRLADGKVQPGSLTVLHNGVLIQDHVPVPETPTTAAPLQGLAERGPIFLQDHGNPVRYRNIWIRPL